MLIFCSTFKKKCLGIIFFVYFNKTWWKYAKFENDFATTWIWQERFQEFFYIDFKTFTVILILIFNDRGKGRHKSSLGKLEPAKITEEFFSNVWERLFLKQYNYTSLPDIIMSKQMTIMYRIYWHVSKIRENCSNLIPLRWRTFLKP